MTVKEINPGPDVTTDEQIGGVYFVSSFPHIPADHFSSFLTDWIKNYMSTTFRKQPLTCLRMKKKVVHDSLCRHCRLCVDASEGQRRGCGPQAEGACFFNGQFGPLRDITMQGIWDEQSPRRRFVRGPPPLCGPLSMCVKKLSTCLLQ